MTINEIDNVLETLYTNGNQSVKIGDKEYNKYSISELLKLREILVNNANVSTDNPQSKSILRVRLVRGV